MNHFLRHLLRYDKPIINSSLRAMLVISGFYMFAFGMFSPIYAIFVEKIGGDITTASNAWAVFYLVAGLLTFAAGRWENRKQNAAWGIICSQLIVALAYITYYLADKVQMLYLAQVLLGMAAALFWPAFHSIYGKHIDKRNSVWQWSFYDGMAYLVPAVSAVIGGFLVKIHGFDSIFLVMALLSLISAVYMLFLPKRLI